MGAYDDADFSGYATKAGLKCSDGRTIMQDAFKHMDGMQVPLVWQHGHSDAENVLGHALLEARDDGVYAYGFFNDTAKGKHAKALVQHEDVNKLSIYANKLLERSKQVFHGMITEVSLVLSGANPGALIDYVRVAHSDGEIETLEDEAIIHTGLEIDHVYFDEDEEDVAEHAEGDNMTIEEVVNSMTDVQKNVMYYIVGQALEGAKADDTVAQSDLDSKESTEGNASAGTTTEGSLTHQEGNIVTKNVFETGGKSAASGERHTLSHSDLLSIMEDAQELKSLKAAVEGYALKHGIDDIEVLFPDAKAVQDRPEWNKRRMEWVQKVIGAARKTPFSRIKTLMADLTLDQARAKGYVKGNLKKEQWFRVTKRTTGPQTIYKKQKLDRDDIIDITDFDVVAWIKGELRMMLEEELARAVLIGDGREIEDEDKIQDPAGAASGNGIRSILNDDDLYAGTVYVNLDDASSSYIEFIDQFIMSRHLYKGSGMPTLFTTEIHLGKMLTVRDGENRRYFRTVSELASELRVTDIVPVEVMEDHPEVVGIMVDMSDYNIGADRGGEINFFDDFDIDFNQYKYLLESRASGALVKIKSALIFKKTAAAAVITTPSIPIQSGDEVTIVNTTGLTYKIGSFVGDVTYNGSPVTVNQTVTASFPIVLPSGGEVTVYAFATNEATHQIPNNVEDEWTFTYDA